MGVELAIVGDGGFEQLIGETDIFRFRELGLYVRTDQRETEEARPRRRLIRQSQARGHARSV